jgi:hypothetical protein
MKVMAQIKASLEAEKHHRHQKPCSKNVTTTILTVVGEGESLPMPKSSPQQLNDGATTEYTSPIPSTMASAMSPTTQANGHRLPSSTSTGSAAAGSAGVSSPVSNGVPVGVEQREEQQEWPREGKCTAAADDQQQHQDAEDGWS